MPLQKRHEERKSKLEKNTLDLKRNYTEALEERKTIKSKQKEHEIAQTTASKGIWKLKSTLKYFMAYNANKNAQKQLTQEQERENAQNANKAWDVVAIKVKKNAARENLTNTQGCRNKAMETMPNGKCKHLLEQV